MYKCKLMLPARLLFPASPSSKRIPLAMNTIRFQVTAFLLALWMCAIECVPARAEGDWEITPSSEQSLELGLRWLAENQGAEGNWESNDLGLVAVGALAYMSAGYAPGRGKYGANLQRALDYIVNNAKGSGLLNIAHGRRDMYNHGLATVVLGQANGMTTTRDQQLNKVLDRALKLIADTQCDDGGWRYESERHPTGNDLSLAVMQAKALRSAMDSGLEVPPEIVRRAIAGVREHYQPQGIKKTDAESEQMRVPGFFTYQRSGGGGTIAMSAAGVVCLQEFGEYGDWRIGKNMEVIGAAIQGLPKAGARNGSMPFDAYTLYYVGQALYQVGEQDWEKHYPILRDYLVASQFQDAANPRLHGGWDDHGARGERRVGGVPGYLYATSVACFVLAMPNRYLPILQEGQIESLKNRYGNK